MTRAALVFVGATGGVYGWTHNNGPLLILAFFALLLLVWLNEVVDPERRL